ncbi:MAG TPA: hypothetical protein VEK08_09540 [Planctomycetota bacterium]|nr:hypothetical protein [Planctomycetota bacterium]
MANTVPESVLDHIRVNGGFKSIVRLPLTVVPGKPAPWKPYPKHFTFSGRVPFEITGDTVICELRTATNEMIGEGIYHLNIAVKCLLDRPQYPCEWYVKLKNVPDPAKIDELEFCIPGRRPDDAPQIHTARETAKDSRVFTTQAGHELTIEIIENTQEKDTLYVDVKRGDEVLMNSVDLRETDGASLKFACSYFELLETPAALRYVFDLPADGNVESLQSVTVQLPPELNGRAGEPLVLKRDKDEENISFHGSWRGSFVHLTLTRNGAELHAEMRAQGLLVNGPLLKENGRFTFTFNYDGRTGRYQAGEVTGGQDKHETLWEPYIAVVRAPARTNEKQLNQAFDWYYANRLIRLIARPGAAPDGRSEWVVPGPDQKPLVMIVPARVGLRGDSTSIVYVGKAKGPGGAFTVRATVYYGSFETPPDEMAVVATQNEYRAWDYQFPGIKLLKDAEPPSGLGGPHEKLTPGNYVGILRRCDQQAAAFFIGDPRK